MKSIEAYIGAQNGERRAAAFRARIEKSVRSLAFMPGIGSFRPYAKRGRRVFSVSPWVIVYFPLKDGIRVLRVVDGRRNLSVILRRSR
jgi:plasmid stabilization system protein ParE